MPRYESAALRDERAALHHQLRGLFDKARTENRNMTSEESQEASRIEERFNASTAELRQLEMLEGYSPTRNDRVERNDRSGGGASIATRSGQFQAEDFEHRSAFVDYLRTGDATELRTAFATTPGPNGGYAVPQSWADSIRDILVDQGAIRALADVQETTTGVVLNMPLVATQATAGIRAEAGAISGVESEDTLQTAALGAYEVSQLVKSSREFLRDGVNIDAYLTRRIGQAIGVKEAALFATGTGGGSQPTGLVPSATVGKTAATATAIVYADLVDLLFSVPSPYRGKTAAWITSDTSAAAIMKLTDSNGNPIWIPNLMIGQPDLLLGRPFYTDPNIPAIATGNRTVLFGTISEFMIRSVGGIEVQVLNELYAANGQIGFIGREYVDSALLNTSAVKCLKQP